MAYAHTNSKGRTYFLHSKEVMLRSGKKQEIYFFAKAVQPGALHVLPSGKIVVENEKTGLPVLKSVRNDEQPKGNTKVLEGEQIKVNVENNALHSNGTPTTTKNVFSENGNTENKISNEENDNEPVVKEDNLEQNTPDEKIKINPLSLVLLPGQLLVVAAAKLMMSAFSKPTPPKMEEDDIEIFDDI